MVVREEEDSTATARARTDRRDPRSPSSLLALSHVSASSRSSPSSSIAHATATAALLPEHLSNLLLLPNHDTDSLPQQEEENDRDYGGGGGGAVVDFRRNAVTTTATRRRSSGPNPPPPSAALRTTSDDRMSLNPALEVAQNLTRSSADHSYSSLRTTASSSIHSFSSALFDFTEEPLQHRQQLGEEEVQNIRVSRNNMANMDTALPENDGMQSLREKLQEIKQLAVSTEEKAKRMHFLMMKDYMKHKEQLETDTDASEVDVAAAAAMPIDPENPYNLCPGDLDMVISPLPKNPKDHEEDDDNSEMMEDDLPELGCMHYKRNVKVQCFDCQRWFPCRHCHDQADDLPFPHNLNRKKTQNMLCMLCKTPQPAAEICINCGNYAAWYFCPKCKLWDNDSNKRIYHCDDCGICRVGEGLGKDYVHCRRCNVCISISTSAAHPCIERATEGNCPLCLIPLFESRTPVVSLPCGHYMHGDCYQDLMAVTYRCPVCNKSAVNMELQWRKLDDEIRAQPMPEEDENLEGLIPHVEGHADVDAAHETDSNGESHQRRPRQVWVGCNDCGRRSWTPFHWLGLKCQRCDSYNTVQMPPTAVHETEAERVMRQQQIHRHDFTGNAVLLDAGIGVAEPEDFVTGALEVPQSPSHRPANTGPNSPRLASGAQSPGRYFVHDEEIHRSNFTTPRFAAPSMPNLANLPNLPDMPRMPRMPNLPHLPNLPNLQNMRQNMRQNLPNMAMPSVDLPLPRFSPYEMIDSLSRSLSPMRYYLRGLDTRDDIETVRLRGEHGRPTSARSDDGILATATTATVGKALRLNGKVRSREVEGLWESEEEGEATDDGDDESIHALPPADDSEEEDEGSSSGNDTDTEMGGDEREELELFGHR